MARRRDNGLGTRPRPHKGGGFVMDITLPNPDGGAGKRRSVYGRTESEAKAKAADMYERARTGRPVTGAQMTVGEWAEGRRYLGLDILAKSRINLVPTNDTQEVTTTQPLALTA